MLPAPTSVTDATRCGLSLMVVGTTAGLLLLQVDVPSWWQLLVSSVLGAYFALEMPRLWRQ